MDLFIDTRPANTSNWITIIMKMCLFNLQLNDLKKGYTTTQGGLLFFCGFLFILFIATTVLSLHFFRY